MKEKEFTFTGIIDKDYKKKILIKINSIVLPFFALITLFFIAVTLGSTEVEARNPEGPIANIIGVSDLLFWLILFVVVVPYIIIMHYYDNFKHSHIYLYPKLYF